MQEATEQYIERNDVTFELRAINGDGEVLLHETSNISFGDVADLSTLLDERFEKIVQEAEESRQDLDEAVETDTLIQDRSY